jgi:hypothetical protein
MTIVFATCDHQPLLTEDDAVLAAALRPLGIEVTPIPWTEIDPFATLDAPPIVLRSTWDYHRMPTMFALWLQGLHDSGRQVWNPATVALGNINKIYLQQLEARGIAIPKTRWLDCATPEAVTQLLTGEGWSKGVLKPRIAATAYGTFLVGAETQLTEEDLTPARSSGALLQEFIPEIAVNGETSLIYCDGAFSHAVIKRAKAGDFRVQKDFGGTVEATVPSHDVITFGDHVIRLAAQDCLYARVDMVATARGPRLMELELIEPELYFLAHPEAAGRFAMAIAGRLSP